MILSQILIAEIIPQDNYQNKDVVNMAKSLLGKIITTRFDGKITSGIIVETESYRGPDDRGSHAYGGRFTDRTRTMYSNGGAGYVYICYGMHPMFNVVTGPEGDAHVVLIRGIEPIQGLDVMAERRKQNKISPNLTNGPAKLAVALGITKEMDGTLLYNEDSQILISEGTVRKGKYEIVTGLRVGMSVHVGPCAYRPWRFYIKNNKFVSKPLYVTYDF